MAYEGLTYDELLEMAVRRIKEKGVLRNPGELSEIIDDVISEISDIVEFVVNEVKRSGNLKINPNGNIVDGYETWYHSSVKCVSKHTSIWEVTGRLIYFKLKEDIGRIYKNDKL